MKILIVGNAGYIGPVLLKYIRQVRASWDVTGFDAGFFAHCLTAAPYWPELDLDFQSWGDVRRFPDELLEGVDAVVQLAAVSNDPMGNRFEAVTHEINAKAAINIAAQAKTCGVRSFVFASSCSIYGFATSGARKETEALNPLTAYAKSKVEAEKGLKELASDEFCVTALRFATACGMSDRMRLDLALNDFVASAVATGEITVLSDGTPWRPLIHVRDMARAVDWAIGRQKKDSGAFLAVNVGCDEWNRQIGEMAEAVACVIPNSRVSINKNAQPDKRSYKVDFSRFAELAPNHQPRVGLDEAIEDLKTGLTAMKFEDRHFRDSNLIRLKVLESHIRHGVLNERLERIEKKRKRESNAI